MQLHWKLFVVHFPLSLLDPSSRSSQSRIETTLRGSIRQKQMARRRWRRNKGMIIHLTRMFTPKKKHVTIGLANSSHSSRQPWDPSCDAVDLPSRGQWTETFGWTRCGTEWKSWWRTRATRYRSSVFPRRSATHTKQSWRIATSCIPHEKAEGRIHRERLMSPAVRSTEWSLDLSTCCNLQDCGWADGRVLC